MRTEAKDGGKSVFKIKGFSLLSAKGALQTTDGAAVEEAVKGCLETAV